MQTDDPITKITKLINRPDGSQVKIIAEAFYGAGLHRSIDVRVHRRQSDDSNWELCSKLPHPDWRTMSVEEYVKRGRSEMLKTVTHGEIFKVTSLIGKPMSCLAAESQAL